MTSLTLAPDNAAILAERAARRDKRPGPRVGDFVRFPDGREGRFSHDWGEDIQWSSGGSFYLGRAGASFSGALNEAIPKDRLQRAPEKKDGRFWFFDGDVHRAHNGVDVLTPCRIFLSLDPQK